MNKRLYGKYFKPILDIILALLLVVIFSPIILIIYLLSYVIFDGHVLFKQQRPGLNNKVFTVYKFRTMVDKYDQNGSLLSDGDRLTNFGKFLRATSLDELPELLNVLKGEMSLIGPRPLLIEYLPRYTLAQLRRHLIKPGITGLAQVKGRNSISWKKKIEYDVWYIEHVSFGLDLKILMLTVLHVLRRTGISAAGHATMPTFTNQRPK